MVIKLRSYEGQIFEVPETVAMQSQVLFRLIEDMDPKAPVHVLPGTETPVPVVTSKVLRKVLEYCKKHAEAEDAANTQMAEEGSSTTPASAITSDQMLKNWDERFVNGVDQEMLYDLIMAANYLEIDGLLDLACQKVADIIHGRDASEIRRILGIPNDITAEDEFEIYCENQWTMT